MPEGPEIKRAADKVAEVLVDQRIEDIYFGLKPLKRYESQLRGQRILSLKTRGKAILIAFEEGLTMYSHNQLYGRWETVKAGQLPDTKRSLRVAIHTGDNSALLYSASDIEILDQKGVEQHPFLVKLGPDLLDEELHWSVIAERLGQSEFRNRRLSSLYLDQGFLAGVGNYLRTEILFHARVSPFTKPGLLNQKQRNKLARSSLQLGWRSYKTAGLTNSPQNIKKLKSNGESQEGYRFFVFNREGLPCQVCGEKIVKTEAGRRIYYCPGCQQT